MHNTSHQTAPAEQHSTAQHVVNQGTPVLMREDLQVCTHVCVCRTIECRWCKSATQAYTQHKVFPPRANNNTGVCVRGEEPPSSQDVKPMGFILWR